MSTSLDLSHRRVGKVLLAALLSIAVLQPAMAQDGAKPRRVGVLLSSSLSDPIAKRLWDTLVDGLREHGWEEGRNLVLEGRFAGGDPARFPELAAELVALKVDVIVASNMQNMEAARRHTATIPIVMASGVLASGVLAGSGFVESLARPGSNVTGLVTHVEAVGKQLQVLKEIRPGIERICIIYDPDNAGSRAGSKAQQEQMGPRLGLTLVPIPVSRPADFDVAFATIIRERPQALHVHGVPIVYMHRARIAAFAIEQRLPTVTSGNLLARDGLLMSYGYDVAWNWRRAAGYVDRILKGANPADLPIEQAQRFELIVNLKTARQLGLTIPPSILLRADEVIE